MGKRAPDRPGHIGTTVKEEPPKTETETKLSGTVKIDEDRNGQKRIPGTEREANPAIEAQALKVYDLQMARIEAAKAENAERKLLTKMMKEANIPEQDLPDDLIVELDQEPKAKVHKRKSKKSPHEGETDDNEGEDEDPEEE